MKILALDAGGTTMKSAIIGDDNELLAMQVTPTNSTSPEVLMETALQVAAGYDDYDVLSVSMTGQIDHQNRSVLFRYFTGQAAATAGVPVGQRLEEAVKKPVFLLNDSNAAALGEAHLGAGRGHKDFLCLTYGTGVGGAIIQDGRLYTGQVGIAGEVGHMVTHVGGRLCGCGHRGCYERYASTSALVKAARRHDPTIENAKQLLEAAPDDPRLRRVLSSWEREIVEGLCTLTYIFNPGCLILGGGIMERENVFLAVQKKFQKRVIPTFSDVRIVPAQLGNRAGMYGAAVYARQQLETLRR